AENRRRLEEASVLQEEWPPLRKKDLEPLVDRHLRLVGFHLAEIGIQRQIERKGVVQHDLRVQTATKLALTDEVGAREPFRVEISRGGGNPVGDELQIATGRNVLETGRSGKLLDEALNAPRDVRPVRFLVVPLDDPPEGDAPGLL